MKKGNSFVSFLARNGFYIVLFLCVAAVGTAGYVLFFQKQPAESENDEAVFDYEYQDFVESTQTKEPKATGNIEDAPVFSETESQDVSEDEPQDIEPVTVTEELYVAPVSGEVIFDFSGDELVFNRTMDDWRVHSGTDYAADLGTQVKAITDGEVTRVYDDALLGKTVEIVHGEYTARYSNLSDAVTVEPGQAVACGAVIGCIGDTATAETNEQAHLHLAVLCDDRYVDPSEIIGK